MSLVVKIVMGFAFAKLDMYSAMTKLRKKFLNIFLILCIINENLVSESM